MFSVVNEWDETQSSYFGYLQVEAVGEQRLQFVCVLFRLEAGHKGEQEVVVGQDYQESGSEVEGYRHPPQVTPRRYARHSTQWWHHVIYLK